MTKDILLTLLLTTIVVQMGFKTKTQLQRLSEGYVDFKPPKINKQDDEEDTKSDNEKTETHKSITQSTLDITSQKQYMTLDSYA